MAFGIAVAIVALQFVFAEFFPYPIIPEGQSFYERDKILGWKLIPHKQKGRTVVRKIRLDETINSQGFRDREHFYNKPPDIFRIVVLGDSFCDQLEMPTKKLFHRVLERKLNSEANKPIEIINLGIGGFGTAQQYLALKYYGLNYRPDLVILAFSVPTDVHDNSVERQGRDTGSRPFFVFKNGRLEHRRPNLGPTSIESKTLLQTIKDFANKYFPDVVDGMRNTPLIAKFWLAFGLRHEEPNLPNNIHPQFQLYLEDYPSEIENAWAVTKALILKMARELDTSKIGFLVVIIPNEAEFRPDWWNKVVQENPAMRHLKFDLRKPERILSKFLEPNHIDSLLLRPEFEKYGTGKNFYTQDRRWNADGHALAAELIYEKLTHNGLVRAKLRNEDIPTKRGLHVTAQ